MSRKHISTYINLGFILILALVILFLGVLFSMYVHNFSIDSVLSRLEVALQIAEDQMYLRDGAIEGKLQQVVYYEDIGKMIQDKEYSALNQLISHVEVQDWDYYLIVDQDGMIRGSNDHRLGEKWELSYLLDPLSKGHDPLYTQEILSANAVENSAISFQKKVEIKLDAATNTTLDAAYLRLILYPIYGDSQRFQGAFVGGYLLNNYHALAEDYTKKVPDTYLSIGNAQGLRICSNINVGDFTYLEGTMQENPFVASIRDGQGWRGQVFMEHGEKGIIVADPVYNYRGEVIGSLGVGAPVFAVPDLGYGYALTILALCLLLFVLAVFMIRCLSKIITAPIYKLQRFSRACAANKTPSDDIEQQDPYTPVEICNLAEDIMIMAQKLTSENSCLEEKVKDRTRQLVDTINELTTANKYRSQFLANISHELRTPLNSIIGFAALTKDEIFGNLNADQKKHIDVIIESGNHLLSLIDDILHIIKLDSKIERLDMNPVDIKKMLQSVIISVFPLLQAKDQTLDLDLRPDAGLPTAYWDEQKIKQIILNLLTNAIKFTPADRSILIKAEVTGDQCLAMQVIDSGIGIPEDMKERVFLAFEQAESGYTRIYQGVGLGLAISKNLVEMHHGKIWLEDNPTGGTKVWVTLPLNPFVKTETN